MLFSLIYFFYRLESNRLRRSQVIVTMRLLPGNSNVPLHRKICPKNLGPLICTNKMIDVIFEGKKKLHVWCYFGTLAIPLVLHLNFAALLQKLVCAFIYANNTWASKSVAIFNKNHILVPYLDPFNFVYIWITVPSTLAIRNMNGWKRS